MIYRLKLVFRNVFILCMLDEWWKLIIVNLVFEILVVNL